MMKNKKNIRNFERDVLNNIPVSINCQLGDPLQDTQWEDTRKKIISLEKSKHQGPVAIITKLILSDAQLKIIKESPLDIWLFMTITGLNENKALSFEKIKDGYVKACKSIENVIIYIRPIIPDKNDNLDIILPIIKLALLGRKKIVARGFKDINSDRLLRYESKEFIANLAEICQREGIELYRKTICAVSAKLNQPCPVHDKKAPQNIVFIKKIGYPIKFFQGELLPDNSKGQSYPWTRGDKNFIRIICKREPKISNFRDTTLLSINKDRKLCDCSSSWFAWARQKKCTINCWYCLNKWSSKLGRSKDVGCNPIDLTWLIK